jgi:hypothetical protein
MYADEFLWVISSLCISGWFATSIFLLYEPAYPRYNI